MDWVFGFHDYQSILWRRRKTLVVLWVQPQKSFFSEEKQRIFGWKGYLSLFKDFAAWSFFLSFMVCDKIVFFLNLIWKYGITSWTTCLIRNSDTPMLLVVDLTDLLVSLSIIVRSHQKIRIRTIRARFSSRRSFGLTPKQCKFFVEELRAWTVTPQRAVFKFLEKIISPLNFCPYRQRPIYSSLLSNRK